MNLRLHITALIIVVIPVMISCKRKELPEPVVQSPVFRAEGVIGNESVVLEAGNNGLAMDAYFTRNSFGVYEYVSAFVREGCDSCGGILEVTIMGHQSLGWNELPDAASSFQVGGYTFSDGPMQSANPRTLRFFAEYFPDATYEWDFGDGQESDEMNPVHTFPIPGPYPVRLAVTRSGFSNQITQQVVVGINDGPCDLNFSSVYLGDRTWKFSRKKEFPGWGEGWDDEWDDEYTWLIDGVPVGDDHELIRTFPGPDSAVYEICLINSESEWECPGLICRSITAVPGTLPCLANFEVSRVPQVESLSNVRIRYTRGSDGKRFDSRQAHNQGPDSYFNVINVTQYPTALHGFATKRLDIQFSVPLEAEGPSNEMIEAKNVKVSMAFVYPD